MIGLLIKVLLLLPKVNFGKWTRLEEIRRKISKAVGENAVEFAKAIQHYLSTAFPFISLKNLYWEEALILHHLHVEKNLPKSIPILKADDKKYDPPSWDYDGRNYFYLAHTLASRYGWTLEYISRMSVDDALAMIQEVSVSDQLEKEFVYSLSDIAYPYNKTTKQSVYKPMERPVWMRAKAKEIKTILIPKIMMPVGDGVDTSGMLKALNERKNKAPKS